MREETTMFGGAAGTRGKLKINHEKNTTDIFCCFVCSIESVAKRFGQPL
jgi:hypothetical protein